MDQNNNWSWGVGGVVLHGKDILLVRHTYGSAKGKLLIPGGYVQNDEMPEAAVVREVYEETGITATVRNFLGIRFQKKNWYAIFLLDYVSGNARSDDHENDFAGFLRMSDALKRDDLTAFSRLIVESVMNGAAVIPLNEYYSGNNRSDYMYYGL